jgi:dihydrofolate reductase
MKAILAMAQNRVIGKNGGLPWPSIKEDFKWFREFTMGKKLIVGKNTFDTLPLLKNREILVLTRMVEELDAYVQNQYFVNNNGLSGKMIDIRDVIIFELKNNPDIIVSGGAKTYVRLLPYITEFYVTHVNGSYDGDTFMSSFEDLFTNKEVVKEFDGHKVVVYTR